MHTDHLQGNQRITVSGHLEEKRGIYQMCLSWVDSDGKRGRKSKSTRLPIKGNKKRAEAMLARFRREWEEQLAAQPQQCDITHTEDLLFAGFMENIWLEAIRPSVKKTTYGGYWCNVKKAIAPYFRQRGILLHDLTAKHINDFYAERLKTVKATSVLKYHANISKALKYAVEEGLLEHSVMDRVKRPKKERYVGKFLKQSEVVQLFDAVKGHKLELGVLLGAFYGLRRGEIIGLKWDAIDFEQGTITIEHTVTTAMEDGKCILVAEDTTKSSSSFRTLPLVPQFHAKLLEVLETQEQNRALCGNSYHTEYDGYIYRDKLGRRIHPNYLTTAFPIFLEKHGFRRIRFHDLRHSCASLLLANGVSLKAIQEWLGHAEFSVTANTYAHLEFDSKLASARSMKWIEETNLGLLEKGNETKEKLPA